MTIIQDIIEKSNKSIQKIADDMECSRPTLYSWMRDPKTMQVKDIQKFAEVMRRSPRNIFSLIINN